MGKLSKGGKKIIQNKRIYGLDERNIYRRESWLPTVRHSPKTFTGASSVRGAWQPVQRGWNVVSRAKNLISWVPSLVTLIHDRQ